MSDMVCDHCGSTDAVVHLTQIVNNEMSTFHLCEKCAAEKGLETTPEPAGVPLTDFLAQMGHEQVEVLGRLGEAWDRPRLEATRDGLIITSDQGAERLKGTILHPVGDLLHDDPLPTAPGTGRRACEHAAA